MENGLVEAFAYPVGLGMPSFGLCMLYAANPQVKLIVMRFHLAAILRATVGKHPDYPHIMGSKQGQNLVIE